MKFNTTDNFFSEQIISIIINIFNTKHRRKRRKECKNKWKKICHTGWCSECQIKKILFFVHCYEDDDYYGEYDCPCGCPTMGNYVLKCPSCGENKDVDEDGCEI